MSGSRGFVVTAAAGGIGGALVGRLLAGGHAVAACDISSRRLAALAERHADAGDRLSTAKLDVADEAAAADFVAAQVERLGQVHGVANVAGGITGIGEDIIDRPAADLSLDEFRGSYRLNLETAFVMTRALLPHFSAQAYGKVANVASLAAFGNFDAMGNAAYDAAKAAVIGLTRSLSRSLGPQGVRVNVVAPGSIYTDKVREVFSDAFIERQTARIPLRQMPGPDDVAALLEFLLLPGSDLISGEVVRVAGGLR